MIASMLCNHPSSQPLLIEPDVEGNKPAKKKFKSYPIGFFHIDIAEVQTAEGKLYLFVAIDRTSKFAFVQLVEKANRVTASAFLEDLIAAVPYKIHTVLTDNGIEHRFPEISGSADRSARYSARVLPLRPSPHRRSSCRRSPAS